MTDFQPRISAPLNGKRADRDVFYGDEMTEIQPTRFSLFTMKSTALIHSERYVPISPDHQVDQEKKAIGLSMHRDQSPFDALYPPQFGVAFPIRGYLILPVADIVNCRPTMTSHRDFRLTMFLHNRPSFLTY